MVIKVGHLISNPGSVLPCYLVFLNLTFLVYDLEITVIQNVQGCGEE